MPKLNSRSQKTNSTPFLPVEYRPRGIYLLQNASSYTRHIYRVRCVSRQRKDDSDSKIQAFTMMVADFILPELRADPAVRIPKCPSFRVLDKWGFDQPALSTGTHQRSMAHN
jgi:hypothetical protein